MKAIVICVLLLIGLRGIAQNNGYPSIGSPFGNTMQRLVIPKYFRAPTGAVPSLNGGIDSVGALFYNTTNHGLYKYDGGNVWTRVDSSTSSGTGSNSGFVSVPYSNTLKFSYNKISSPHTVTAPETFTVATDTMKLYTQTFQTIIGNGSVLTFDTSVFDFDQNIKPQFDKINDILYTYIGNGKVWVHVSTRNANYANLIYSLAGNTGFITQSGYYWQVWWVHNPTAGNISVKAGTTVGGSDIIAPTTVLPNDTPIFVNRKFDTPTSVYFTFPVGITVQWSVNNPGLNGSIY